MPSALQTIAPFTLAVTLLLLQGSSLSAEAPQAKIDALVSAKQFDEAAKLARELDEASDGQADLTLSLARLARALQLEGRQADAAEFFQRAVQASTRPAASGLAPQSIVIVRQAAAAALADLDRFPESLAALRPTLDPGSQASDAQRVVAVSICLRIGARALARGASVTAAEAYAIALKFADDQQRPSAMLGDAWAIAIQNQQPQEAAEKLAAFIDQYPQHSDAPRAALARAECLQQAGRGDKATQLRTDLLDRWPDSETAAQVAASYCKLAVDLVPEPVRCWLMRKANANELQAFDTAMTMLGMLVATQQNELTAWSNLARHLAQIDQTGQATSDTLARLVDEGHADDAERLAALWIARPQEPEAAATAVTPLAREAACRWAGRTQRWSMLSLAAEQEPLDADLAARTVATERLLAEALMQTGQVEAASRWWNHLVDGRQSSDFSTLLRCAEAETAVGRDAGLAERRISTARQAAGQDPFHLSLVDLLDAELAIRRTQFDQARALLENVVRASETDAAVRGRAQWLIGETHYLQRDFAVAIEAYRRVEGIDPSGVWVSASLIQAGKSFEQLGRTREAVVCYGILLNRFAETAHATLARRRLAAIAPDHDPSNEPSGKTIRR